MSTALRPMVARYRGTCTTCHEPITPGDEIEHAGRGLTYHAGPCADAHDPAAEPTPSRQYGRRRSARTYRGRCEDAPCCGCCGVY